MSIPAFALRSAVAARVEVISVTNPSAAKMAKWSILGRRRKVRETPPRSIPKASRT